MTHLCSAYISILSRLETALCGLHVFMKPTLALNSEISEDDDMRNSFYLALGYYGSYFLAT
jgi:hypothetical protein